MPKSSSLLRTKRYGLFWISSLLSNIGTWMQQVAQPWIVFNLTGSSFWVGLDSFAMNAPAWLFSLWGGVLADRFDRKRIILIFQAIQFVSVLVLLVLLVTGNLRIWEIIVISFLVGSTDALSMPAFQSVIPSLVDSDELPRAIALNSTQFNLSRVLGPAIGGFLLTAAGARACFGANLVSYLPFFLSIYWIYPRPEMKDAGSTMGSAGMKIREHGYLSMLRDPVFRVPLLILFISAAFCSPLISFTSVIVKNVFQAGPGVLGWSAASFGIGGVIGALFFPAFSTFFSKPSRFAGWVAVGVGAITAMVSFAHSLLIFDLLLFFGGAALTLSNTSVNSALQGNATNLFRGRVVSLFQLTLHGGISTGSLLTGIISSKYGIQKALLINGALAVAFQLVVLAFQRK